MVYFYCYGFADVSVEKNAKWGEGEGTFRIIGTDGMFVGKFELNPLKGD